RVEPSSTQRVMPAPEHCDSRVACEQSRVVEAGEPALRAGGAHRRPPGKRRDADEPRHSRRIPGCIGVVDRRLELAVRLAPVGGTPVEVAYELRLLARELGEQELAEQVVEAEPLATMVEWDEEEVRALDRLQPAGRVASLEH